MTGGCACLSAILNYHYNGADVSTIYQVLANSYPGLSAPFHCDFSPYSDGPVNLALIQTQPPITFYQLIALLAGMGVEKSLTAAP